MTKAPAAEPAVLALSPRGHLVLEPPLDAAEAVSGALAARVRAAHARGQGHLVLHLATTELDARLPPAFAYVRDLGALLLAKLCQHPDLADAPDSLDAPPPRELLAERVEAAPPMPGGEYWSEGVLEGLWTDALAAFGSELAETGGSPQEFLRARNPAWNLVGRVHFHLAERKGDAERPFAFLATYTTRMGPGVKPQHRPLGQAIAESAGARDRTALLGLLQPVQRAADHSALIRELLEQKALFQPQAWTPDQAYRFLRAVPECEAAGVIVRVPDWWHARRPPRPQVSVTIGSKRPSVLGLDALLDFEVGVSLEGERLTQAELRELLAHAGGLARLRGRWVEIDRARLSEVLEHWRRVKKVAGADGVTFIQGMRLLAGAEIDAGSAEPDAPVHGWSEVHAGSWLEQSLAALRQPPDGAVERSGVGLLGTLRPYQEVGVCWLRLLAGLGLGACLADDMGLGKTIQVIAALLQAKRAPGYGPNLLVAPASLLANWQAELERFAPSLGVFVAHPSALGPAELARVRPRDVADRDLVITTYGSTWRLEWLGQVEWNYLILDEAQAIKTPGAKQTRAVKALRSRSRIALTGTPIENRLSDLWSLFDFLNPGLLGSARAFGDFVKRIEAGEPRDFSPLRRLVGPYILRRLKSDRTVIADLPDKTELKAYCGLAKEQAALYQEAVLELAQQLERLAGIERRGVVLAFLMRMKQICNHPSQWLGDGSYAPAASGKFARVTELAESIGARQEKALFFTQFRELAEPLAAHLAAAFGRKGLVLHGGTTLPERKRRVAQFQEDDAVPFFVLSVKAGGTGLNLTAASHVVHFDRWWNPAVEDQATDRAYRIGQKRNVLVHKFVCRGTVEERIDAMIAEKRGLAGDVLGGDAGKLLTEMGDRELLDFVRLDLQRATATL